MHGGSWELGEDPQAENKLGQILVWKSMMQVLSSRPGLNGVAVSPGVGLQRVVFVYHRYFIICSTIFTCRFGDRLKARFTGYSQNWSWM